MKNNKLYYRIPKIIISLVYLLLCSLKKIIFKIFDKEDNKKCVVLYYHSVRDDQRASFMKQMDMLKKWTIPVPSDNMSKLDSKGRYSVVTFDDGFQNLVRNAVPEMEARYIPFTIFIPVNNIGSSPNWNVEDTRQDKNEQIMTEEEIRSLPQNLATIGSHTMSHRNLLGLNNSGLIMELCESKHKLEELLGKQIKTLSFPHGLYNDDVLNTAFNCGYERVFTIDPEFSILDRSDKVTGRVVVSPSNWNIEFYLKMMGAYTWFSTFLKFKKMLFKNNSKIKPDPETVHNHEFKSTPLL